jgi:hypothetical protein
MAGAVGFGVEHAVIGAERDVLGAGDRGAAADLDAGMVLQVGRGIGVRDGDETADIAERVRGARERGPACVRAVATGGDVDVVEAEQLGVRADQHLVVGTDGDVGVREPDAGKPVGADIGVRRDVGDRIGAEIDDAEGVQHDVVAELHGIRQRVLGGAGAIAGRYAGTLQQASGGEGRGVVAEELAPGLHQDRSGGGGRTRTADQDDAVLELDLGRAVDPGPRRRAGTVDAAAGGCTHGIPEFELLIRVLAGQRDRLQAARQIATIRAGASGRDAGAGAELGQHVDICIVAGERRAGAERGSLQAVDERGIACRMAGADRGEPGQDDCVGAERGRLRPRCWRSSPPRRNRHRGRRCRPRPARSAYPRRSPSG